jgi:hypothetical protein
MSTINLHQTTTLTPEQYVAGLTDFGPGRSKLFGNSADAYLKIQAPPRPTSRKAQAVSGNACTTTGPIPTALSCYDRFQSMGRRVGPYLPFTRHPNGTTDIDVVVVRDGKNLRGRLLGFVVGTIGKGVLENAFKNSVKAIELRNGV